MSTPIPVKIVILGDTSVGKTSIVKQLKTNNFDDTEPPTVGASNTNIKRIYNGKTIDLQLWDTAGQERFQSLSVTYARNAQIVILTYSITDRQSFDSIRTWNNDLEKVDLDTNCVKYLVANKIDLSSESLVDKEQGESLAEDLGAKFISVSAKTGQSIPNLLELLTETAASFDINSSDDDLKPIDDKKISCCV